MCIDHTIRCTISKKWTFVHTEISFHHTIRAAYRVARSPVCSAQGAIPRSGDRRALVCARTCAPFSWTRDCTVPGGRTSPLERRRARARVGRSRVSCIGVCAVAVMFKGACLGLGEGDWPGGVGNVVVTVALPCTSAAATAALPRWAGMATGDIRVTMTGESAGTASTATRTPGMESVLAIADATLIPGTMTTEGDTAEASEASAASAVTVARPAGRVWRQGI